MNLATNFFSVAKRLPDRVALTDEDRRVTFAEAATRASALAGAFRHRLGLDEGDRVVLCMENGADYIEVMLACWTAGLAIVPVNIKLHPSEILFIAEDAGAALMICSASLAGDFASAPDHVASLREVLVVGDDRYAALAADDPIDVAPRDGGDLAWVFYTSGTTGRPKGAMLTHRNLAFMSLCYYADVEKVEPGDTALHFLPLSHGAGLYALPHLLRGGHQLIHRGSFETGRVFDALRAHRDVTFFAVPTIMKRLVEAPDADAAAARNLKTLWYGGAPAYAADIEKALALFGPKLLQLYGQGESPCTISVLGRQAHADRGHPLWAERIRSCGYARTGVALKVVDDDGRDVPTGEIGEVVTRSDCVMAGYWNNPAASAETLRGGWLHTGDLGSLDDAGCLTLRDRSKDMIISGGTNIYPREIEEVLQRHVDVAEISVIGRPSAEWGEEVVAFVVARPGAALDAAALDAFCAGHIARFKRPRDYRFLPELPKSGYGKILKTELRDLIGQEDAAAGATRREG